MMKCGPSGFTLIELLAVIVLVAMAASATAVAFSGAGDQVSLHEAESRILWADRRARSLGLSGNPVSLVVEDHEIVIDTGDRLERYRIPSPVRATFMEARSDTTCVSIEYDRIGRSQDYAVVLSTPDRVIRCRVHGLTGWAETVQDGAIQ